MIDRDGLVDYIKWLLNELDEIDNDSIDRTQARIMLLSIIGEMYK